MNVPATAHELFQSLQDEWWRSSRKSFLTSVTFRERERERDRDRDRDRDRETETETETERQTDRQTEIRHTDGETERERERGRAYALIKRMLIDEEIMLQVPHSAVSLESTARTTASA